MPASGNTLVSNGNKIQSESNLCSTNRWQKYTLLPHCVSLMCLMTFAAVRQIEDGMNGKMIYWGC